MAEGNRTYIQVIVPLKIEWEPFYYVEGKAPEVGDRVVVQFSGKEHTGVVSEVGVIPPQGMEYRIRPVSEVLELDKITNEEIRLWRFVSQYYLCTIGEVYKGAYPSLRTQSEINKLSFEKKKEEIEVKKKEEALWKMGREKERLALAVAKNEASLRKARTEATRTRYREAVDSSREKLAELDRRIALLSTDNDGNEPSPPEMRPEEEIKSSFILSDAQAQAVSQIDSSLESGRPALLLGVTGSGKTEIFLEKAIQTLRSGRNVLYLVPEVALSRQLEERLRKVFGSLLLTFHSGETIVHRREVGSRIRHGRYIVLGTRSAIFLPHSNLGLVVVDEEHDHSFKQETPVPRYNARDCAAVLSKIFSAHLILGSATPSLESLYNTTTGKYTLVSLTQRYHGGQSAEVEIIDTRAERRKRGMRGSFSLKLIEHIRQTLSEGGQVVILRSRRAFGGALQCDSCGEIPRCPRCNVPLSYHKEKSLLVCHHCGYRIPYPDICPKCKEGHLLPIIAGTEKIEEEASVLFPDVRIGRLDSDSGSSAQREKAIIKDFERGTTKILIGTQMVSKGFDFDSVRLVAVLAADSFMAQDDFRSDEKALQTLEQFRGRCSRRGQKGLFIIQTACPEHPIYKEIAGPEEGEEPTGSQFIEKMLEERKAFSQPPYTRIVLLTLKDSNYQRLTAMASSLSSSLHQALGAETALLPSASSLRKVSLVGPYPPRLDKLRGEHILCIRISFPRDGELSSRKRILACEIAKFEKERKYSHHISIDVDPA